MKVSRVRAMVVAALLAVAAPAGGAGAAGAMGAGGATIEITAAPAGTFAWSSLHASFDDDLAPSVPAQGPVTPAASSPSLPLLGLLPPVELRTPLVAVHLLGLCFGLGGSTLLYFWIFRWIRWGYLPAEILRTFDFVAKAVAVGLALLWLSGIGFLALYWLCDPAKLANPKIWAKLAIVSALSLNGLLVHRLVSPFIHGAASAPLLRRETVARRLLFIGSGTMSGTSWYAAFALGLLREFNGKVSAGLILGGWILAMGIVFVAFQLVLSRGRNDHPEQGAATLRGAIAGHRRD